MGLIYSRFRETAQKYSGRDAVCWKQDGKWKKRSYGAFLSTVDSLGSGLLEIGVEKNDRLAIFSENRPEWLASDLAINKINAVSVPIHATANTNMAEYILNDSGSSYLIVSREVFQKHYSSEKNFFDKFPQIKKLIFFESSADVDTKSETFKNLVATGSRNKKDIQSVGQLDEVASIVYTSGVSGDPKGVMLTNFNFVSNVDSATQRIKVGPDDKMLSFLPLSHVLERTAGNYAPIFCGSCIAYAESIKKLAENLKEIKPTIIIAVPKVFERIYEKVFAEVKQKGELPKRIFYWALRQKAGTFKFFVADKLALVKVRKAFGGKLRFAVSGGASINERILKFFKRTGVVAIEGYGLTETSPIISANSLEENKFGTVGPALLGTEIKIAADKEVMVRGSSVMKGYWNKDDLTKEVLDENGWFMTGDLGFLDGDNYLTIIGRKKDIIVTNNGKNIAPEKIEGVINLSPYVKQSLVVGHKKSCLAALIVPEEDAIAEKIKEADGKLNEQEILKKEIEKLNSQLDHWEKIKKFEIIRSPFTIENEELTPTLKVRRKIIERNYQGVIEGIYK